MHLFSDHCGVTADPNGYCIIVVDGDYGQPKGALCECEEHEEV